MKAWFAFAALLAASGAATAADGKIPIATFFKLPEYSAMVISPDGEHIAALAPVNGRQNLVVLDLEHRKGVPITRMDNKDIVQVFWLNDKRLMVRTGRLGTRQDDIRGGAMYAVDADGSNERKVIEGGDETANDTGYAVWHGLDYVRRIPDTDDFIANEYVYEQYKVSPGLLYRINSRTGRRTPISGTMPDTGDSDEWVVDRKGVARVLSVRSNKRERIWYRAGEDAAWQKLDEFPTLSGDSWEPLAVAEDDRTLYVSSHRGGRDKAAIVRYDPAKKEFGEVIAAHPQVDLEQLVYPKEKLLGVRYNADKVGSAWFDEGLAQVQAAVDKSLPGNVNILSFSDDHQRFVVTSYSDVLPASFYHFDRKTGKLQFLADRSPWIDPKKMSPMTPVRYKARDGLEIPAYLTIPKGSPGKNLPLVMVIHGGPWVTGDGWYFDPEVQFLASRGYAVLQPNYRGTLRYGWKHYATSFKQWGGTMQDDITDGVKWAVAEGIADPRRVCIYGGSYGGYATMMGLAKDPDLYKCGVNYVGVTDLDLFINATWSDFAYSAILRNEFKDTFGDWSTDAARLHSVSPVELASRIKAPVLMAYGASDVRVVPDHGWRMKAAMEKAGNTPQWIIAEGEGHGYRDPGNQVMFYGAMEKFLDKYIGPDAK
ncbi:MAG TPA: alpha/beta fold hydrolase [Usitatibacter sp.]|nr:alpha/beta fold hydrolase [Usitatibacter sp.]